MSLPSAQQLTAIAAIITAFTGPLGLLVNAYIVLKQHKIKKLINGRMEQLVMTTRSDALKEGTLQAIATSQAPPKKAAVKALETQE